MLETQWRAIVSGERKDTDAFVIRFFLWIASMFYLLGFGLKKLVYTLGIIKPAAFDSKIVSIGNITVGGTGKTPVTEELAKRAVNEGRNVLIVSRGYKRKKNAAIEVVSDGNEMFLTSRAAGDEPFILARRIKGAKVIVADSKVKGIRYGITRFKPDIVFLDDGFQRRDEIAGAMHVVLIDALNPFGFGKIFPAGGLREPVSAIRKASAIVLTNVNLLSGQEELAALEQKILKIAKNAKIFQAEQQPKYVYNIFSGDKHGLAFLKDKKVIVFSSLGNPLGFEKTIKSLGAHVIISLRFPDHHRFTKKELNGISKLLDRTSAAAMITTEKDEVRISRKFLEEKRVFALRSGLLIRDIKDLEKRVKL